MSERDLIWDPLRKKEVALTPEERVRQWCIGLLSGTCHIPVHMMMSEAGFRLGGKQLRADIIVYDRNARPLMIVECKREDVEITQEVLDQAIRYNMVLDVRYIMITNGKRVFMCRRQGDGFEFLSSLPVYEDMLK